MKQNLKNLGNIAGKNALVRFDLNLPFDDTGKVTDNTRVKAILPTLNYLIENKAKTIIITHLGRPKGKVVEELRVDRIADELRKFIKVPVKKVNNIIGEEVEAEIARLNEGEILVLENIRFHPGETLNDPELSKTLAQLGDFYVNDAFGASHRKHCSTYGIVDYIYPSVAGFLLEKEVAMLGKILHNPTAPFIAIIGGSKVSTKIEVLEGLLDKVNTIVIGGAMAFTFLKSQGISVGRSLVEDDLLATAKNFLQTAQQKNVEIFIPSDVLIAPELSNNVPTENVSVNNIKEEWMGLDIGTESIQKILSLISKAKTVFWNGPVGAFETSNFSFGTYEIAKKLAELTKSGQILTVLGGGDTIAAIEQSGIDQSSYSHISTGGGASLEYISGKTLPGIEALEKACTQVL